MNKPEKKDTAGSRTYEEDVGYNKACDEWEKFLPDALEIAHILQNSTREHESGVFYYIHSNDFWKLAKAISKRLGAK